MQYFKSRKTTYMTYSILSDTNCFNEFCSKYGRIHSNASVTYGSRSYISKWLTSGTTNISSYVVHYCFCISDRSRLQTVQHFYKSRIIVIYYLAVTEVKFCDLLHILVGKCEVPDVDILFHTLNMNGLREN